MTSIAMTLLWITLILSLSLSSSIFLLLRPDPISRQFLQGWIMLLCSLLWGMALGLLATLPLTGAVSIQISQGITFIVDATAALMLGIVTTVGWCACRFATRYLTGEPYENRYWRWSGATLGMVAIMVVSGNLAVFLAAWIGTSFALHQLLILESNRPTAKRTAWTKFTISRIGDIALLLALLLIYNHFGTLDFESLSHAAQSHNPSENTGSFTAWLIVIGAMTKSAQIPFHFWLPDTLETPTPVSALMHAGVINAGGYLILRTYPLVIDVPSARFLLIAIGTATACIAAMIMLTQTSIKRALAYSTIAQMGFMMLQCGLGAYAAAMLHILAHSAYKAYAFLNSGTIPKTHLIHSVVGNQHPSNDPLANPHWFARFPRTAATFVTIVGYAIPLLIWQIDPREKAGGIVLGGLFVIGIGHWLSGVFSHASWRVARNAIGIVFLMGFSATTALWGVSLYLAPAFPYSIKPLPLSFIFPIASFFLIPLILESLVTHGHPRHFASRLYVDALNGFYLDIWGRCLIRRLKESFTFCRTRLIGS